MRHTVFGIVGIWLVSAGAVMAQGLPEGTYASSKEGCAKLEAKTTADLGDDFDFYVLTGKGLMGYEQACDFVNVSAHNAMSWVATAFCDEQGYTYPDLFSIAQKDEGTLAVTRLTDLTQQGAPETSELRGLGIGGSGVFGRDRRREGALGWRVPRPGGRKPGGLASERLCPLPEREAVAF